MGKIAAEIHVPFRLRALLRKSERTNLDADTSPFSSGGEKTVALLEKLVREKRRIIRGIASGAGTFEYQNIDGDEESVGVENFMRWEFPGLQYSSGDIVVADGNKPAEFVLTARFTVAIFREKKRGRVFVRKGVAELDMTFMNTFGSVADAIVCIEADGDADVKRFIAPVAKEIIDCNLLGG